MRDNAPPRPGEFAAQTSSTRHTARSGWFLQLLRRLHFFAAIFVGPFILVAAASGALYALAPTLEQIVYAHELHAPPSATTLPLAEQVRVASTYLGVNHEVTAVRPAAEHGDTTRVMFSDPALGTSETRAIFVDPATAFIRGDLTVYGNTGSLPLRAWIDQLHRGLHLGDAGRLYSELAASWLGIIALAGAGLWIQRFRRARNRGDLIRPSTTAAGYRRYFSWHTSTGIWVVIGMLMLSATGITWSQFAGANVSQLRTDLGWSTPAVRTDAGAAPTAPDPHAEHGGSGSHGMANMPDMPDMPDSPPQPDLGSYDAVLAAARAVNIASSEVEIRPPTTPTSAWVVRENRVSWPVAANAVSIEQGTLRVVDRIDFASFPLAAKLANWGVAAHMGLLFGLPNQIALFVLALAIVAMVIWGYLMWWKRRPTRVPRPLMGRPPARGALRAAPWWGTALVLLAAGGIGLFLPLLGTSLAAFVLVDLVWGFVSHRRAIARSTGSVSSAE